MVIKLQLNLSVGVELKKFVQRLKIYKRKYNVNTSMIEDTGALGMNFYYCTAASLTVEPGLG